MWGDVPTTSSDLEAATLRLVAQCLNQHATACPNQRRELEEILIMDKIQDGALCSCTLSKVRSSKYKETQRFGNCMFPSSREKMETPTLLGSLERTNLNTESSD
jgi:hypothetical protein